MNRIVLVVVFGLCLACLGLVSHLLAPEKQVSAGVNLQQALSDVSGSFAEVTPGREFTFPADHGAHPSYKTEWWYFTGNLQGAEDRRYGYQLTLFRVGLAKSEKNSSSWSTDFLMMGHFALSDLQAQDFHSFERISRPSLGLAGVEGTEVWLEDWTVQRKEDSKLWHLKAQAHTEEGKPVAMEFELSDLKAPVLQGDGGYSRKGPLPQHASYYVSQTRLKTTGTVRIGERLDSITGLSWFDHEWSSEAMAEGLVGWDWFSLQLDEQSELMIYLLRYADGRLEGASSGVMIHPDNTKTKLTIEDMKVRATATHLSPKGVEYPSAWQIEIPKLELKLSVVPNLADQEMESRVPYWEGSVRVEGTKKERAVTGQGFVELTGY